MYDIKIIGDNVLRKKAFRVTEFDNDLLNLSKDMIETMHNNNGIGLAAPQINILKRIIVVDISPVEKDYEAMAFINPEILESWGSIIFEEGCLSVPGVNEDVERPEKILLKYQTVTGENKTEEFDGWMARVLQHEIDHLNGILFIDYLSPLKQKLALNKFETI